MKKKLVSCFPYIFFGILAVAPFFWNVGAGIYTYLGGSDFSSAVDLLFEIRKYFFVYNPNYAAGYEHAASLSALFPYHFITWVLSLAHITPLVNVLIFISIILLVSQISMFQYLRYVLSDTFHLNKAPGYFWAVLGAGLYGFSPYPIGLIAPGHFFSLVFYALFPWIFLWYTRLLEAKKMSRKALIILFFLFLGCVSGAAYSISILYVLTIVLFAYTVLSIIFSHLPFAGTLKRFLLVVAIMVLANAWWLTPFLVTQYFTYGQYAANPISSGVEIATQHATIGNIFLGRAEGQLYESIAYIHYFKFPVVLLFLCMTACMGYALIHRRTYRIIPIFFGMVLLGIFISKGVQEPFGEIFQFLYDHIPGFQIFRRPISKFYWEFFFFFIALFVSGIAISESRIARYRRIIRMIGGMISAGGIIWLWYSFTIAGGLQPYNIPSYYYEARNILREENATRIFLLPGTLGLYPLFNRSANNYNGVDFINELWNVSIISPDPTDYSLDLPYKKLSNALMTAIGSGRNFCAEAKTLGVSHIVLRNDYSDSARIEMPARIIKPFLDESADVESRREFGDAYGDVSLYRLKPECRTDLLFLEYSDKSPAFQYSMDNPVQITIKLTGVFKPGKIVFLNNFFRLWKAYPIPFYAGILPSIFSKGPQIPDRYHSEVNGFANGWTIDPTYIKQMYDKRFYEEHQDGSMDIRFILYFQPQSAYYFGIALTIASGSIMVWMYIKEKKYGK